MYIPHYTTNVGKNWDDLNDSPYQQAIFHPPTFSVAGSRPRSGRSSTDVSDTTVVSTSSSTTVTLKSGSFTSTTSTASNLGRKIWYVFFLISPICWTPSGNNIRYPTKREVQKFIGSKVPKNMAIWDMWSFPGGISTALAPAFAPKGNDRWWQLRHFWNFHPDPWGKDPILTNIFEMGWNHQPEKERLHLPSPSFG